MPLYAEKYAICAMQVLAKYAIAYSHITSIPSRLADSNFLPSENGIISFSCGFVKVSVGLNK